MDIMYVGKRILSLMLVSLLALSILSVFWAELKVSAQGVGSLTGTIYDSGLDTDDDGAFNFLEVGVEVNVSTAGTFRVEVSGLFDSAYNYIAVWDDVFAYLDLGIQVVYLHLDGPTIYESRFDPTNVTDIYLDDENYTLLDFMFGVPLSRQYNYTEFDSPPPPPAFLTGTVSDRGVDTDGDGAFDYLEVSVEINVSDPGQYEVEVWGLLDSTFGYIDVGDANSDYLDAGVQVVDVLLYGPTIYASGLDPVVISEVSLYFVEYVPPLAYMRTWVGSLYDVPLSREYLYTEFDSPFQDIEVSLVVYPDGRVAMGGTLNYTHVEPPNTSPSMHGVVTCEKSDNATGLSANFTIVVPPEEASQFPSNSSDFTLLSEYSSGLLTTTVSGSTILLPSLSSEFPFNITDFTVIGEYGSNVEGNITVDIWNGFPLDDIVIDFTGNNTYIHLNGSTTVIFGSYPDLELNATVLEQLLAELTNTLGGQGPGSLYNMTNGMLEFTMLSNVTTIHNGDATVDFEAKVEGDLIQMMVNMTGQPAPLYDMLNTSWSSVESGSLLLTYSHALKQADMSFVFVANVTYLTNNIIPILPELMSPEEAALIESILDPEYWSIDSASVSLDYKNGQATLVATATIQDFNTALNYIKGQILAYNSTQPWTNQLQTLNETQIELTSFSMSFYLAETSIEVDVTVFAILPPLDWINATSFKLERFLNVTASEDEPPGAGEKLKVTVAGGSNSTHTVTITSPGTVPEPDTSAPGGMIWNNQSISELKDLIFQIGPRDNTTPVIGTPMQTPETPDDGEVVTVSVNVTDADTGVPPDGVILSYRTDGSAWINVTMSKTTGDTYEGTIPGLPAGTQVEYMIVAYDYANNEAIKDKAGEYYVYIVITEFPNWQIIALALLLIGIIFVTIKRRNKITENPTLSNFFSIFVRAR